MKALRRILHSATIFIAICFRQCPQADLANIYFQLNWYLIIRCLPPNSILYLLFIWHFFFKWASSLEAVNHLFEKFFPVGAFERFPAIILNLANGSGLVDSNIIFYCICLFVVFFSLFVPRNIIPIIFHFICSLHFLSFLTPSYIFFLLLSNFNIFCYNPIDFIL